MRLHRDRVELSRRAGSDAERDAAADFCIDGRDITAQLARKCARYCGVISTQERKITENCHWSSSSSYQLCRPCSKVVPTVETRP